MTLFESYLPQLSTMCVLLHAVGASSRAPVAVPPTVLAPGCLGYCPQNEVGLLELVAGTDWRLIVQNDTSKQSYHPGT